MWIWVKNAVNRAEGDGFLAVLNFTKKFDNFYILIVLCKSSESFLINYFRGNLGKHRHSFLVLKPLFFGNFEKCNEKLVGNKLI